MDKFYYESTGKSIDEFYESADKCPICGKPIISDNPGMYIPRDLSDLDYGGQYHICNKCMKKLIDIISVAKKEEIKDE